MLIKRYFDRIKNEFAGYNAKKLGADAMSGLTVTAVALPLALAFGVACGADAASGLITAIIAGLVISALSGASFQISGPTGAMAAVLVTIVTKHGIQGVFVVGLLAGIIILLCGVLRLGKLVGLIPAPVVTGFTSGIAIVIALGQVDNLFGTTSAGDTAVTKLLSYGTLGFHPNFYALGVGLLVILIMILYPKKWNARVPSSLVSIIVVSLAAYFADFDITRVGEIPRTLLPAVRLNLAGFDFSAIPSLLPSALTVAALGMIESLLCGASASRMKGESFDADVELVGQGIGNILIPFFGGVPATAAIARTSVAIKSGCQTRLCGIFHAVGLLASMFLLGSLMSELPLAALAGVLIITSWRMNDWHTIKEYFGKGYTGAIVQYLVTMLATVVFDLTVAILIGIGIAVLGFLAGALELDVVQSRISNEKLSRITDTDIETAHRGGLVVYISGSIFFANCSRLADALDNLLDIDELFLSMRGVANVDINGALELVRIIKAYRDIGVSVKLSGVGVRVERKLRKAGLYEAITENDVYASIDRALI